MRRENEREKTAIYEQKSKAISLLLEKVLTTMVWKKLWSSVCIAKSMDVLPLRDKVLACLVWQIVWCLACNAKYMAILPLNEKALTCMVWQIVWCLACNAKSMFILPLNEKVHYEGEDRISELPEDTMLTILCHLGMKEAAKTSIFSKRWRYLWTNMADLDFDYLDVLPEFQDSNVRRNLNAFHITKYVNWVDQVVRLHNGPSIDKFRVRFYLFKRDQDHIDRWVQFAMSKRVKNLELDMFCLYASPSLPKYTLGFDTLKPSSLFDSVIRFLTSLHLNTVDVSGQFLEFLLSECLLLERLFVELSSVLVRLKVESSKLKHLTIRDCCHLDELEIHAVNLWYLEFFGHANIKFKSVPAIVEAALGGKCCLASVPIFQQIACFSMQLSRLSLDLSEQESDHYLYEIPVVGLPCFSNVKRLELKVCCFLVDIPGVSRILGACPVLREFKLEIFWPCDLSREAYALRKLDSTPMDEQESDVHRGNTNTLENALPNLKVLEFHGFRGCMFDVPVLLHILVLANELEILICHSCFRFLTKDEKEEVRRRTHKIARIIPPKLNVVIK